MNHRSRVPFLLVISVLSTYPAQSWPHTHGVMLAKTADPPDKRMTKLALKDCRDMSSTLHNLIETLGRGLSVVVSQPNAVGNQVIPANPSPTGMLNNGYVPLRAKEIDSYGDKIREQSLGLEDELTQLTANSALAVFDSTHDIKGKIAVLNQQRQELLQCLGSRGFDRKIASDDASALLKSVDEIDHLLKQYHQPLQ